jgi:hypothetical protein
MFQLLLLYPLVHIVRFSHLPSPLMFVYILAAVGSIGAPSLTRNFHFSFIDDLYVVSTFIISLPI